jgi:prolipoprotein diacylglyceryl transferase
MIVGTIIGARLGHCFLYDPYYYLSNPVKILAVWEGGLASHGGGIGVVLSLYLYKRKTQESYLWLLDRVAIPTALAAFFIRIGNLFNSEIIGIPTQGPWAVIFEKVDSIPRHPAQVYEALSYILIFFILMFIYKKRERQLNNGLIFGVFLILIFTSRFFIEFVKSSQESYSTSFWMSTGQILSIPFIIAGILLIIVTFKPHLPNQ